jgi:nucleotide-binding universal stress UspA family protein
MRRIVVGVDGSEASRRALTWARDEAMLRSLPLEVVSAWGMPPVPVVPEISAWSAEAVADMGPATKEMVEEMLRDVVAERDLDVEVSVVQGAPAAALLDEAADAELLVVGSRGLGGFRSLLLGSVSQQCAQHAPCPVVIVPSERDK